MYAAYRAAALRHPNIARVLDAGEDNDEFCVVGEFVSGQSAERIMDKLRGQNRQMPAEVAVALVLGALDALAYVHGFTDPEGRALGLVHGDVSGRSMMLSYDGAVKVVDFGFPVARHPSLRLLSPEQTLGEVFDGRSDLYSVCAILFEMLAGRPLVPFGPKAHQLNAVCREAAPRLSSLNEELPRALDGVLARGLAKRPSGRWSTASELASALRVAAGPLVTATRASLGLFVSDLFREEKERVAKLLGLDPDPGATSNEPCSAQGPEPQALRVVHAGAEPASFAGHRLLQLVEDRGLASVWLAESPCEQVVVLCRLAEGCASDSDLNVARLFRSEIELWDELHAPFLELIDRGTHEGRDYATLLCPPAASLRELLRELQEGAPERLALELVRELALAGELGQAHLRAWERPSVTGWFSRPERFALTPEGRLRIWDPFPDRVGGVWVRLRGGMVDPSEIEFLSPEEVASNHALSSSDVFSLGALLYRLLAGCGPFGASAESPSPLPILDRIFATRYAPLRERSPTVREPVERIVDRCLRREPASRYPDPGALAVDLSELLGTRGHSGALGAFVTGSRALRAARAAGPPMRFE